MLIEKNLKQKYQYLEKFYAVFLNPNNIELSNELL